MRPVVCQRPCWKGSLPCNLIYFFHAADIYLVVYVQAFDISSVTLQSIQYPFMHELALQQLGWAQTNSSCMPSSITSITSIKSSTVQSSFSRMSALWHLYSCIANHYSVGKLTHHQALKGVMTQTKSSMHAGSSRPYLQDSLTHLLIQIRQRNNAVEGDTTSLLLLEIDVGRASVQADSHRL